MHTVHLTAQTVKGLTAGITGRTDYFDTIGRYPDLSLADARDRAKIARNEVARGVDPSATKIQLRRAETFGELADQFIDDYAKPRKRTWRIDQGDIGSELARWRHVKAADVKRRDVIALLKAIADRPAPIKANRIQALIRKIYNWAIGRDLVETHPCTGIVPFGKESRRTRVLTNDELVQFWEAAEASWHSATETPAGAILQLELLTAQRGQEVRWMRWSDLDLDRGWWLLPGKSAKNRPTSHVPLTTPPLSPPPPP